MIGGIIYKVEDISENEKWIGCIDTYGDKCGVICETKAHLRPGDNLWWQAGRCFWTPSFQDKRFEDIAYPKIGGSGVSLRTARENRKKLANLCEDYVECLKKKTGELNDV